MSAVNVMHILWHGNANNVVMAVPIVCFKARETKRHLSNLMLCHKENVKTSIIITKVYAVGTCGRSVATYALLQFVACSRPPPSRRRRTSPTLSPIMITITQGERNERGQVPVKT